MNDIVREDGDSTAQPLSEREQLREQIRSGEITLEEAQAAAEAISEDAVTEVEESGASTTHISQGDDAPTLRVESNLAVESDLATDAPA